MSRGRISAVILLCVLTGVTVAFRSPGNPASNAGDVNDSRVATESSQGANWLLNGRTYDEQHFSPLAQITDKNVSQLGLQWFLDVDTAMGVVSEPIAVDGVIYVSAPLSVVYAVDAASGKVLWKFDPKVRLNMAINGSYSARTNGGVAVWNGKVYVGTGDCRLVAADASTGQQVWEAQVCDATQTGITGAPHVAKGRILIGYNGSDDGVRGSLVAYDADSGKEVWRFWTVPRPGEPGYDTWQGKDVEHGGAPTWFTGSYDPDLDIVYWPVGNPGKEYNGDDR
ncbi:MAG TPA: PQQ-binding-like beta-propeller repeat protein, partial [Terriglobales bacterium]|nr:PQQ-binding-like beta-propeller repeat protein [Terriglobales bacterium]